MDGEEVSLGQGTTSSDLKNNYERNMKGIGAALSGVGDNLNARDEALSELKQWFWEVIPAVLAISFAIAIAIMVARRSPWPWNLIFAVIALILFASGVYLISTLADKVKFYQDIIGEADRWVKFGKAMKNWVLPGMLGAGVVAGLLGHVTETKVLSMNLLEIAGVVLGFGGAGAVGVKEFIFDKDQYLTEEQAEQAKQEREVEENKKADEEEFERKNGGGQ